MNHGDLTKRKPGFLTKENEKVVLYSADLAHLPHSIPHGTYSFLLGPDVNRLRWCFMEPHSSNQKQSWSCPKSSQHEHINKGSISGSPTFGPSLCAAASAMQIKLLTVAGESEVVEIHTGRISELTGP